MKQPKIKITSIDQDFGIRDVIACTWNNNELSTVTVDFSNGMVMYLNSDGSYKNMNGNLTGILIKE